MKKPIPMLLALTFLLSLGSAVLADDTGSSNSHTYTDPENDHTPLEQKITTNIPENKITWYLEIPDVITINQGGYNGRVNLRNVKIIVDSKEQLSEKQKIEATLTYDGVLTDKVNTDNNGNYLKIDYLLNNKNDTLVGEDVDEEPVVEAALKTGTAYVVGTKTKADETYSAPDAWVREYTWDMAESGDYEGTVVYASKLVETDA